MPLEDLNQEVAPISTGFADLPPAGAAPEPALDLLIQQADAERRAIKAAAEAEERMQVQRQERAEEPIDTRSDAQKFNDQLHQRIIDARVAAREAEKPKPPQQPSQHVMDQTKREMEEGAKQSKWHADQRAAAMGGKPPPEPRRGMSPNPARNGMDGPNTEVFRPQDFVPDQVKGQGYVKVTS